jgi:hypothetical protein
MLFSAKHVTRTRTICLSGNPDRVFPLFEPIGEKFWAEGWNPQMLYPKSGVTERGAVFTTQSHDGTQTIWLITHYDPKQFEIGYARVTPESNVAEVDIRCEQSKNASTEARVTYVFTALSEQGNEYINKFTEEYYREWIGAWEKAIDYYLAHGRLFKHHE